MSGDGGRGTGYGGRGTARTNDGKTDGAEGRMGEGGRRGEKGGGWTEGRTDGWEHRLSVKKKRMFSYFPYENEGLFRKKNTHFVFFS